MREKFEIPGVIRTLGEAVRFVRERRGLTLREVARRIGVSAPFLSDVEHNRRSTDKLHELASALDVPFEDLSKFDGRLSGDIKEWIAANPQVAALLEELRASGRTAQELRAALLSLKK
jgi:transcriptional regulator with XRE-family HTH domain